MIQFASSLVSFTSKIRPVLPGSTYSTNDGTFDTITGFANVYDKGITPLEEYWKRFS
jgi:hypothetical protein